MVKETLKYFIKLEGEQVGPLTMQQIMKLKTSYMTLVRNVESEKWEFLESLNEFKTFKRKKNRKKILSLVILFIIVGGSLYFINEINSKSSYIPSEVIEEPLPPPPVINYRLTEHDKNFLVELFKDCNLSGEKSQVMESCDYYTPAVRNKAVSLAGKSSGNYNLGQICDIYDYCRNNWKYVNDPKSSEIIELASNTILNGYNGDCDDFAVLMCSFILSIGGEARINYAYNGSGGHVFTEVNIGSENNEEIDNYLLKRYGRRISINGIWTRADSHGNRWLNLDWNSEHPGGEYFKFDYGTTFYVLQKYCQKFSAS